jgi:hypothetical protein
MRRAGAGDMGKSMYLWPRPLRRPREIRPVGGETGHLPDAAG